MSPEMLGERIHRQWTGGLERLDEFPALGREDRTELRHRLETDPVIRLDGLAGPRAFEGRAEPLERDARRLNFDMQDIGGHGCLNEWTGVAFMGLMMFQVVERNKPYNRRIKRLEEQ